MRPLPWHLPFSALWPYASLEYRPLAPELFLPTFAAWSARTVHRLANRGKNPLELIEVQTGSYLGEDDIVRLDDIYKRK